MMVLKQNDGLKKKYFYIENCHHFQSIDNNHANLGLLNKLYSFHRIKECCYDSEVIFQNVFSNNFSFQ